SAPVPIVTPEARYSNEARKKRISGECLISFIVDGQGMPRNPRVVKSLGHGLDENALEAVSHYRFKPALKAGYEPIPVMISVAVDFKLH
ncbi:MAG: energy transducer TonB, partial [Terracidiphilus sp.]